MSTRPYRPPPSLTPGGPTGLGDPLAAFVRTPLQPVDPVALGRRARLGARDELRLTEMLARRAAERLAERAALAQRRAEHARRRAESVAVRSGG